MGKFRDGVPATGEAVTLILATIDRIKEILDALEREQREPDGADDDLIAELERMADAQIGRKPARRTRAVGTLVPQVLERPLRRAKTRSTSSSAPSAQRRSSIRRKPPNAPAPSPPKDDDADKVAGQSIRVTVDTLEQLMTMVSELVLTRNQLLEIVRRHEDSEFKVPLQRLSNVTAELQEGVMKTRMQPIGNAWQKLPRIVRDLVARTRQADRARNARRRDRTRPPGARSDQGSAHPHGAQFGRSRPRDAGGAARAPASRSAAASGCPPITRAATSSSRSPTTAAASIPSASRRRRSRRAWRAKPRSTKLSEAQIHKFIFAPGFSTAATVTSVSGRGVGMDVVRNNIDQIGGTIDVQSVAGRGLELHHQDSAHAGDRRRR